MLEMSFWQPFWFQIL